MVRVTGNFTSESPLHHAAREALLAAFDQGWADPKKLSQNSSRAAILRNHALENIASRLGVRPDEIEVIGEPNLGHYLAIAGLLRDDRAFVYSEIDKRKIRAISRAHRGQVIALESNANGQIVWSEDLPTNSVVSLQLANGETGIKQDLMKIPAGQYFIAVDATSSGSRTPLPQRWDTALFDSQSWMGPAGLGILAVRNVTEYSYPLPRIAPIKSPGSYSLPLLIASSIALENFVPENSSLREYAITQFRSLIGCTIVAQDADALPHVFSIVISGVASESLVRELAARGIDIDSGSACSPEDLQPSHVLAAMGYETNGHLRISLHSETARDEIDNVVKEISSVIGKLRN